MSGEIRVPRDLLRQNDLPAGAKFLYVVLLSLCADGSATCTSDGDTLVKLLGIRSRITLRKHIQALTATGWLRFRSERGQPTEYRLSSPRAADDVESRERVLLRVRRAEFKGEALMREWLDLLVKRTSYQDNVRPDFLLNPATGERMEYDRWYPPDVAFEFNGPQHEGATEAYPDPRAAMQQQARDLIKLALSVRHGVHLIVVGPMDLTLDRMREKIGDRLPLRSLDAQDAVIALLTQLSRGYRKTAGRASPPRVARGEGR